MSVGVIDLFNQLAQNDFGFFQRVHSVADVMTREVQTLSLDNTFQDAVALLQRHGFHHAPVISPEDGEVVGIVSDRDVLRHRPRHLGTAAEGDDDHLALRTSVSQMMTRGPVHFAPDAPPAQALTSMLKHRIDCVLVYEDQTDLQGIVTPRDFMKTLLLYHRICTRTSDLKRLRLVDLDLDNGIPLDEIFCRGAQAVRDVMTREPSHITTDDTVEKAINLMQTLKVRHLPVVADEGQLIGMVSDREILRVLPVPQHGATDLNTQQDFRAALFATDDTELLRERVVSIMCRDVPTIRPDALLVEAMDEFQRQTINGLPVVDSTDNRMCGIITTTDILRVFRVVMQLGSIGGVTDSVVGTDAN